MQQDEKGPSGKVHTVTVEAKANAQVTASAKVIRGRQSWDFIYVALAFVLTLESTIIPMFPLVFPYNLLVFTGAAGLTTSLFLFSGQFQDMLLTMRDSYENAAR